MQVKASTHTGKALPVKAYKPSWDEMVYLRIGGGWRMPFSRWVTVIPPDGNKCVTVLENGNILTFPYPFLIGGHPGSGLLIDKFRAANWWVSYTGNSIVFSNEIFFVSMSKRYEP